MKGFHYFLALHLFLLSSVTLLATKATTNETDLNALLTFKSLILADPYGVLSSWNNTVPHCQWPGVMCGSRQPKRVTALVLNSKELSGHISSSLANLTFLRRLSLSDNKLTGNIPQELGSLSTLRFINFTKNFLEGNIPSTLGNCTNLEVLSLKINNLGGTIPADLANCKKLTKLILRENLLVGNIPPEFGSIHQLTLLSLGKNNLTGTIPSTLGNLTNLETLYLHFSRFSGSIPSSFGKLQSLQSLYLCASNISGTIPNSLYNLSAMVDLELCINQLEGTLPSDICEYFPGLQRLLLYENQLTGKFPISLPNCSSITNVELQQNSFTGTIPSSIGKLSNLYWFNIGNNQFETKIRSDWGFFDSLVNCSNLQALGVGYNQFEGPIPISIANFSTSLSLLALNANPISGGIPRGIDKLTNLIGLDLHQTSLGGNIPKEIGSLQKLQILDLSENYMSGEIPSTFGNLTAMTQLYLQSNKLDGHIPPELSRMGVLELLNLSNNKLIGDIPKEIMNLPSLSIGLYLSNNYFKGALPPEIGKLKNVMEISMSNNRLSGKIPNTIDGCQLLQFLRLDRNYLHGPMPPTLSMIKGLKQLDISNNLLYGKIPELIAEMKLQILNISFNNFEGELPKKGVFRNISAIDVRGNPKLCGGIPELHLPHCSRNMIARRPFSRRFVVIIALVVISFLFVIIVRMWLLASLKSRRRSENNPQQVIAMKFQYNGVSYNELLRATNAFSLDQLIGEGTFGAVYRADISFDNVTAVVVKVLKLEQQGACRSFLSECEALRNVRHRNVMRVLNVCSSIDNKGNDFKALVFEFMPNGSLEAWLHNTDTDRLFRSRNLIQTLNIAIDVANALDYLHNHGPNPIIHCDLKPSNVLLDENMSARVGDFGLARLLVQTDTSTCQSTSKSAIKGSVGYIPPEYGMGGKASVEGDVYSYGILLLEMFTGVSPVDERFQDGLNLCKYVEITFPDHIMDIIDTRLLSVNNELKIPYAMEDVEDCLVSVINLGLLCSRESPKERIAMNEVTKKLNSSLAKLLSREAYII